MDIACTICDRIYPQEGLPYLCPQCGGVYDFRTLPPYDPAQIDPRKPGIWRYKHSFGITSDFVPVSLGEGNTPLLWTEIYERKIAFKCEFQNPSGSFKDRGSALIAAWIKSRNMLEAVEDSSGNAGASFAAYAARAGIHSRIFIPEFASGPKRKQIEAYGAELLRIPGSRKDAGIAAKTEADQGVAYASHAYLPFNLPGYATMAYEIFAQLGNKMPGSVILPAGQGGLLLGLARGLESLRIATKYTVNRTIIIGVQAHACAPLWAKFTKGNVAEGMVVDNQTLAEGVRVETPVRTDAVLQAVSASQGTFWVVEEDEIIPCRNALARYGLYVEPTSAIVLAALEHTIQDLPDPVVVILTGAGYKYDLN